jgi:L-threonylcarbamoyladenylate synthase
METSVISTSEQNAVERAIDTIRAGEAVAFPTDTVYGLGVDPFNISAIIKLFEAKGRDYNKAIAILIGNIDQVELIAETFTINARKLVESFWPGGLTVIVPKCKSVPDLLSANQSIGLRMPDHPIALRLLNEFGPLATSSANITGKVNPLNAQDVFSQLGGRIPLILDGGNCPGGVPSTVVDCVTEQTRILRQGAIELKKIESVLSAQVS